MDKSVASKSNEGQRSTEDNHRDEEALALLYALTLEGTLGSSEAIHNNENEYVDENNVTGHRDSFMINQDRVRRNSTTNGSRVPPVSLQISDVDLTTNGIRDSLILNQDRVAKFFDCSK